MSDHVTRLRGLFSEAVRPHAEGRPPYALVDFPHHPNTGDSAIWLGEVELLRQLHGRPASYVCSQFFPLEEIPRMLPEGSVVYLHGGGSFGDIWPLLQTYRETITARCRGQRVVQMPQSIHYDDIAAAESAKRVIGEHPDFHLMVRDEPSLDFARRHFDCETTLVPDAAHAIDPARLVPAGAGSGIRCLLRDDKERRSDADSGRAAFADVPIEDWREIRPVYWERSRTGVRVLRRLAKLGLPGAMAARRAMLDGLANATVSLGLKQLAEAEVIVTDRLHGHILSTLVGRPHVAIDNYYGKIRRFAEAFGPPPNLRLATDYAEARELADELLAQTRAG